MQHTSSQAQPDGVIIPQLDAAQSSAQRAVAAFRNRAVAPGIASVATLTAPTAGILACVVLQARASGIFSVSFCGTAVAGAVEVGGVTLTCESVTPVTAGAGITVANGTQQSGTPVWTSSATTAITLAAASGSLNSEQVLATEEGLNNLASSSLNMPFCFSLGAGAALGFPVAGVALGSWIAFSIAATIATTTVTLTNMAIFVNELP